MATRITPQRTLCKAIRVFTRGPGAGRLHLAPHWMLCDLGSPLPLSGLLCSSSQGQSQTRSRRNIKVDRRPRTFLYGNLW